MAKNQTKKTKQFIADRQIQGGLMVRVAVYWLASLFVTLGVVSGMSFIENGTFAGSFKFVLPALVAGIITLPLAVADVIKFSNRFAGPLVNIRRRFKQLAGGETGNPMKLREDDFLEDLAEHFNILRGNLCNEAEEGQVKATPESVETAV